MLSRLDDYPIEHTPEPIAHRTSSDPNPLVRNRLGDERGVRPLEQIRLGPHAGHGFRGRVAGAPA